MHLNVYVRLCNENCALLTKIILSLIVSVISTFPYFLSDKRCRKNIITFTLSETFTNTHVKSLNVKKPTNRDVWPSHFVYSPSQ